MRQTCKTGRRNYLLTFVTDKAHSYAKVIGELSRYLGPEGANWRVDRKHLDNRIEGDHGALKQLLKPERSF